MTKKDYEAIAARFRVALDRQAILQTRPARVELSRLAAALAHDFERGNDRFDKPRFLRACGLE